MDLVIECQGCDKVWRTTKSVHEFTLEEVIPMESVPDLLQRIAPGEVVPFGECRECGGLCHEEDPEVDRNFARIIERLLEAPVIGLEVSSELYKAIGVVEACSSEKFSKWGSGGVMRRPFPGSGATFRWDVVVDLLLVDGVNGHPSINWAEMEKDTTGTREDAVAHVWRYLDRASGELSEDAGPVEGPARCTFWKVAA